MTFRHSTGGVTTASLLAIGAVLLAAPVKAQPTQGAPGQPVPTQPAPAPTPAPVAPAPEPEPTMEPTMQDTSTDYAAPAEEESSGGSDHERFVGHIGVGFFGMRTLPLAKVDGSGLGEGNQTLSAPTIGVRWWLSPNVGLDLAVALGIDTASASVNSTSQRLFTDYGIGLHGGVPIALHYEKHYKFLIIPEIDFAYTGGKAPGQVNADEDDFTDAFMFQLGARAGAEIHFGFIGIPQLALQGTIGVALRIDSRMADIAQEDGSGNDVSLTAINFKTSVNEEPWDIFIGNITAIYYFD